MSTHAHQWDGLHRGFEYALDNGADVFSMSYMFVNMEIGNYRGVFRLAAEHATAAGMLLCGGAGNFATSAPEGKQITIPKDIPCVLSAAGTKEDGSRPDFSSKGR
ncbi:MAG: S8 family serine peptidase [Fimbriimonadaceae bacterium]